jgi:hypothetical protein
MIKFKLPSSIGLPSVLTNHEFDGKFSVWQEVGAGERLRVDDVITQFDGDGGDDVFPLNPWGCKSTNPKSQMWKIYGWTGCEAAKLPERHDWPFNFKFFCVWRKEKERRRLPLNYYHSKPVPLP